LAFAVRAESWGAGEKAEEVAIVERRIVREARMVRYYLGAYSVGFDVDVDERFVTEPLCCVVATILRSID